jgi:hypothetical protein
MLGAFIMEVGSVQQCCNNFLGFVNSQNESLKIAKYQKSFKHDKL